MGRGSWLRIESYFTLQRSLESSLIREPIRPAQSLKAEVFVCVCVCVTCAYVCVCVYVGECLHVFMYFFVNNSTLDEIFKFLANTLLYNHFLAFNSFLFTTDHIKIIITQNHPQWTSVPFRGQPHSCGADRLYKVV